ncbi:hypothetical protein LTS18_010431 [Coniosporium uncinatum]|uniref:Uncharacterized protein n=1 Tax=Coniosporium uncinatum TaxID=93489 RepID=A0ACC3DA18_9PEZI|nr:hypothetical protein LTS18_010431 [Coniosporium uncinatum]
MFFQILGSTAGQAIRDAVNASGEPPIPQLADLFSDSDIDSSSTTEFWKLCSLREQFRSRYHAYWKSTSDLTACKRPVDGVIMPVAAHAAPPEGSFKYYAWTAIPSMLDYTAGSLPVTFADRFTDHKVPHYNPMSSKDRTNWELYSKDVFDGSPVGVQVVGQRYQEEKVLAMMEAVKLALEAYSKNHLFQSTTTSQDGPIVLL